jgi:hypothetical protein
MVIFDASVVHRGSGYLQSNTRLFFVATEGGKPIQSDSTFIMKDQGKTLNSVNRRNI